MAKTEVNKLDKLFGPSGSFGGIVMLVIGIGALYYSLFAVYIVLLGAFAALTSTCAIIDYEKRRIKYSTSLFGFIHVGKWITIENNMKIWVRQSGRVYRTYSMSNQSIDISIHDFSVVLKDHRGREICPMFRSKGKPEVELKAIQISEGLSIEYQKN